MSAAFCLLTVVPRKKKLLVNEIPTVETMSHINVLAASVECETFRKLQGTEIVIEDYKVADSYSLSSLSILQR